jgi:hypothetical protein
VTHCRAKKRDDVKLPCAVDDAKGRTVAAVRILHLQKVLADVGSAAAPRRPSYSHTLVGRGRERRRLWSAGVRMDFCDLRCEIRRIGGILAGSFPNRLLGLLRSCGESNGGRKRCTSYFVLGGQTKAVRRVWG